MLLYVMTDHPSVSQTFVVTEAAAVRASGVPVVAYALQRGEAKTPAASIDLACTPPSIGRLALEVARAPLTLRRVFRLWRRRRISLREAGRLLLAEAHAHYAWRNVKALGISHVHAHFLGRQADVALALARQLGCKWTATAHAADAYAPFEPALFRRRVESAAGIACASRRVQGALVSHAPQVAAITRVVRCGVDLPALRRKTIRSTAGPRRVVTIARLVATKGHWTILEAAYRMLRDDQTLEWTVIGGGELDTALRRDRRYRVISPRLTFTGPLDHEAALHVLAGARAFVLPCEPDTRGDSDGIPVALMEAMALQVPVITTAVGGIPELVSDRVTGLIVPPKDPASLAEAVGSVLYVMDDQELAALRSAGLTKVEQDFNVELEAAKLIRFIQETSGHRVA